MTTDPDLERFAFDHEGMFLVPADQLLERRVAPSFAALLIERGLVTAPWIAAFDAALARVHARADRLFLAAPETHPPGRVANVCVVTDPTLVRPFVEPFRGMSWLVYATDFAGGASHDENVALGAFSLAFAEQVSATRAPARAFLATATHLLLAPPEEIEALTASARTAQRPDAYAFRKLADAMPTVRAMFHEPLRRPVVMTGTRLVRLEDTRFSLFEQDVPRIVDLANAFDEGVRRAERRFLARAEQKGRGRPSDEITRWLIERRPHLRIVDARGDVVWRPEEADHVSALRSALREATTAGAASMRADLEVVATRTDAFVASVPGFDALAPSDSGLDQGNGIFLVAGHNVLAYGIAQPGFEALREPAPPFHRWLVGARSIHEWAHLAEDSHLVRVPPGAEADFTASRAALDAAFARVVGASPLALELARQEVGLAGASADEVGTAIGGVAMARTGDWLSNVLARAYLPPEEMEAYVRVNVRSHARDGLGPFAQLARYVYEYQYLSLSRVGDPHAYFMATIPFRQFFELPGLCDEASFVSLTGALATVYRHFAVDRDAIHPPG